MSFVLFGIVLVVATTGLVFGSALLGGGLAVIRRRLLLYGLVPVAVGAFLFGIGPFEAALPDGIGPLLVSGMAFLLLILSWRRRSRLSPEVRAADEAAAGRPAFRWLLMAYLATIAVAAFLRVIATVSAG